MEDLRIVDLFFERSEIALAVAEEKYNKYLFTIAYGILSSKEDAEECVNDALMAAWASIPPTRPNSLKHYLGKIVRNISLNLYTKNNAAKRRGEGDLIYDEVSEFTPDPSSHFSPADEIALRDAVNSFLSSLPTVTRVVFLRRYWYFSSVADIAKDYGLSASNVKVMLHRTRKKFKKHLEKEGVMV